MKERHNKQTNKQTNKQRHNKQTNKDITKDIHKTPFASPVGHFVFQDFWASHKNAYLFENICVFTDVCYFGQC